MPRGLGRLPFLPRRSRRSDLGQATLVASRPIDPDLAPVGPPVLLPAAIIRQVLYEATELTPAWALPRPNAITTATLTASAAATATGAAVDPGPPAARTRRARKPASSEATPRSRRTTKSSGDAPPKPRRSTRAKDAG